MGRILLETYEGIISRLPEPGVNQPYLTTADFKTFKFLSFQPPIPQVGKYKSPEIGSGTEFGSKPRNGRWPPIELPVSGWLNTEVFANLAARAYGGAINNVVVAAGVAWDHFVALQEKADGRLPKLSSVSVFNEGDDFLHASMAVNNLDVRFGGDEPPQYGASLINTGYSFTRLQDLDPAIVPGSVEEYHHVHPDAVEVTFNDGTLIDFGADARLISGQCGINNQIVVRSLPKDPFRVAGDRRTGSYARDIHRGKRIYTPTLQAWMDEELAEFVLSCDNTEITSLKYKYIGDPIGPGPHNHEVEFTYPLATVAVAASPQDVNAGLSLSFDIDREDAVGGISSLRVRNGQATLA